MNIVPYNGQEVLDANTIYTMPEIDRTCPLVVKLLDIMKRTTIPITHERKNSGVGRSQPFGIIYKKFQGHTYAYSVKNKQFPDLYEALLEFLKHYSPIKHYAIQVNKNYNAKPHYDMNNIGHSYIFAIGDYRGGEFCAGGHEFDIAYKPILVDATTNLHSVNDILEGDRYSFVYFTGKTIKGQKPSDIGEL